MNLNDAHKAKRFIEQHGFDASQNPTDNPNEVTVSFWLPYVNVNTDETGEWLVTLHELAEVRPALGY